MERLWNTRRPDERVIYIKDYAPHLLNSDVWYTCVLMGIPFDDLFRALDEHWPEIKDEQLARWHQTSAELRIRVRRVNGIYVRV